MLPPQLCWWVLGDDAPGVCVRAGDGGFSSHVPCAGWAARILACCYSLRMATVSVHIAVSEPLWFSCAAQHQHTTPTGTTPHGHLLLPLPPTTCIAGALPGRQPYCFPSPMTGSTVPSRRSMNRSGDGASRPPRGHSRTWLLSPSSSPSATGRALTGEAEGTDAMRPTRLENAPLPQRRSNTTSLEQRILFCYPPPNRQKE